MSATMAAIRAGFTANLASLEPAWDLNEYPSSNSMPPFITVTGAKILYDQAMGHAAHLMEWILLACVPATTDLGSQQLLEQLIDPNATGSLKTLIEADGTLGGNVSWAHVTSVDTPKLYTSTPGMPEALGVEFTVEVLT